MLVSCVAHTVTGFLHHETDALEMGQLPQAELPALIRGYRRACACLHGNPALNPRFSTADFPMLVAVDNVNRRFAPHFDLSPDQAA